MKQYMIIASISLYELIGITPANIRTILAAILAVFLGLLLKLASEWDKDRLTWKRAFIQSMFSSGVGYMVFFWIDDGKYLGLRQELWLCMASFAAAHILTAIDSVSRDKLTTILGRWVDQFVAKAKPEEEDHKDTNKN